MMKPSSELVSAFAPKGRLRASINLGNPVLAHREADGKPAGVSIDLAVEFARLLGVKLELLVFDTAARSVDAVAGEQADVGFFAIDPVRGRQIVFSAPYLLIEGFYLVRESSPLTRNEEVDRPGQRVVVGQGSAYDLYLSRTLTQAAILRAPGSPEVVPHFLQQQADVAAGVKQQLEQDAARFGGLRLLEQRFMVIQQAMGTPRSRGTQAGVFLAGFVEEMKTTGFVATALDRHGIRGAMVAPASAA